MSRLIRQAGGGCKAEQGVRPERTESYVTTHTEATTQQTPPDRRIRQLAFIVGLLLACTTGCGRKGDPVPPEDVPRPSAQSSPQSPGQAPPDHPAP